MLKGIELEGTQLPMLKIAKVTEINLKPRDGMGRIYLEEMVSGKWRLTFTKGTIPDIKCLEAFRLVREEEEDPAVTIKEMVGRIDREAVRKALADVESMVTSLVTQGAEQQDDEHLLANIGALVDAMADLGQAVGYGTRDMLEKERQEKCPRCEGVIDKNTGQCAGCGLIMTRLPEKEKASGSEESEEEGGGPASV